MTSPFRGSASQYSRQKLRGKGFTRISRDVYVLRDREVDLRLRVEAALLALPGAVPCLTTAGLLQKLPVDDDGLLHLARPPGASWSRRDKVTVHRLRVTPSELMDVKGIAVTGGTRTWCDLGAVYALEALVAVGDVVLRRYPFEELELAVASARGRPGAPLLRLALPLLDPGADSPAETRARLRLHAAGFTELRHKVTVRDAAGGWLGTPDLADPVAKVAVQHEGAVHFEKGEKQRRKDVDRDEVVRQEDWQVVSSTAIDDARPDRLITKVSAAYRRAAKLWGPHVLPTHLR